MPSYGMMGESDSPDNQLLLYECAGHEYGEGIAREKVHEDGFLDSLTVYYY